jgi:hypothetical protein
MTVDIPPAVPARLRPVEARFAPLFCFALLTAASLLASFALACATPFAAFAVVAAAMLPLPSALLIVAAAWLVNQAIGFGMLHYPVNASTMLWGLVIGAAALAATGFGAAVLQWLRRAAAPVALGAALIGAYAAYEAVLFAATPFLGGAGSFAATIVGRLGALQVLWLLGLVGVCEIIRLYGPVHSRVQDI